MTINVGIIGTKRGQNGYGLGSYIARDVLNNPDANLIALMDTTRENVRQAVNLINLQPRLRIIFSGAEYTIEQQEEFFRRDDIDLTIICSPAYTHEEYIRQALLNHKHVLVEKPLIEAPEMAGLSEQIGKARTLVEIADMNSLLLSTNCQRVAAFPFLKEHFGMADAPSNIQIELTIGTKFNGLEDPKGLFNLLNAHTISFLVKYGATDYRAMHIKDISSRQDDISIYLGFTGEYRDGNREFSFDISMGQSSKQTLGELKVTVDDIGPLTIKGIIMNDGRVLTQYIDCTGAVDPLYTEDLLKISINKIF